METEPASEITLPCEVKIDGDRYDGLTFCGPAVEELASQSVDRENEEDRKGYVG